MKVLKTHMLLAGMALLLILAAAQTEAEGRMFMKNGDDWDAITTATEQPPKLCPIAANAGGAAQAGNLRALRDQQIDRALGATVATMYYRNMAEITAALSHNHTLRMRFILILRGFMPKVQQLLAEGATTITATEFLQLYDFLTDLKGQTDLTLGADIDFILQGMESGWLLPCLGVSVE